MSAEALFFPEGGTLVPTSAAVGPWSKDALHGGAVAALFAGQLTPPDRTLARVTVELLAPVPNAPLTLEVHPSAGGARVQRQEAVLSCDGRAVASGRSVTIVRGELDLPPEVLDHPSPFDPAAAPSLHEPNQQAADKVGWESFDSEAIAIDFLRGTGDRTAVHQWTRLLLPVVAGTEILGTEMAAVAADYAAMATSRRLDHRAWSYRNAELTLHLSRAPVLPWVGTRADSVVQPVGAGFSTTDLFDAAGRLGRSACALVVERR